MSNGLHPLVRDHVIVIPRTLNTPGILTTGLMALTMFYMGQFISADVLTAMIPAGLVGTVIVERIAGWFFVRHHEEHLAKLGYSIS